MFAPVGIRAESIPLPQFCLLDFFLFRFIDPKKRSILRSSLQHIYIYIEDMRLLLSDFGWMGRPANWNEKALTCF